MATFQVRRPGTSDYIVNDMAQVWEAGETIDLFDMYEPEEITNSNDLDYALSIAALIRVISGSDIPYEEAFNDVHATAADSEASSVATYSESIGRIAKSVADRGQSLARVPVGRASEATSISDRAQSIGQRAESQGLLDNSMIDRSSSIARRSESLSKKDSTANISDNSKAVRAQSIGRRAESQGLLDNSMIDRGSSIARLALSFAIVGDSMADRDESLARVPVGRASEATSIGMRAESLARLGNGSLAVVGDSMADRAESLARSAESQGTLDNSIADRGNSIAFRAQSLAKLDQSQARRAQSIGQRAESQGLLDNSIADRGNSIGYRAQSLGQRDQSLARVANSYATIIDSEVERYVSLANRRKPHLPAGAVQFESEATLGGDAGFIWDNINKRTVLTGPAAGNRTTIYTGTGTPDAAQLPLAATYIQVDGDATFEGIRCYFKRSTAGISGWILYHYDQNTPNIRIIDEDDDPPYIAFMTIGTGTLLAPQWDNRFGSRGAIAGIQTGFQWIVNGAIAAELDTQFFHFPKGTTAQRPTSPVAGWSRYNTTLQGLESYDGVSWQPQVFGTYFNQAVSEGETSSTSTAWIQKVRLTVSNLAAGTYMLQYYAEGRSNTTNDDFQLRVQQNDTTDLFNINIEPKDTTSYFPCSGFALVTLAAGTTYNFDLDYSSELSSSTSYIRRARLALWRVG